MTASFWHLFPALGGDEQWRNGIIAYCPRRCVRCVHKVGPERVIVVVWPCGLTARYTNPISAGILMNYSTDIDNQLLCRSLLSIHSPHLCHRTDA